MKIYLKQIPPDGTDRHEVVSCEDLDLPQDIMTCVSPIVIDVHVQRAGDEVLADCEVSGKYRLACSRCIEEFDIEKTDRFKLVFDIEPQTEFIDLTDDIREELIIAMPVKSVCDSACKGLCPHCGGNLNLDQCTCKSRD